jgi:DNA-binding Lrp family transcriptional regulator
MPGRAIVQVDAIDERILWELVADARIPNNRLAERVGVSPSTSLARVKALKKSGVLVSSHAQVDFEALGFVVQAIVTVTIRAQSRDQINSYARRTIALPNVISIFFVGGPADFLIHVACVSTSQLRDFVTSELSNDPAVAATSTSILFDYLRGAQHLEPGTSFEYMRRAYRDDSYGSDSRPR